MKKLFIILIVTLLSANVHAQTGTTKAGYLACISEEYLDDILAFKRAGDRASGESYVIANKCVSPQKGLKVTILNDKKEGKIQFAYERIVLWTVTSAIALD